MGVYSTTNRINITEVDGTTFKGRYAADGSWNGVNKTGVTSFVGLINPCGAINYTISNSSSSPVPLYAANGSINVTDQGLLNGALSVSISALSAASSMLSLESNGFAVDFTDRSFLASTGFYGSIRIKDTTNEFNSSPDAATSSKLTYSSPSLKMCLGPSGSFRYQAHNLYLNSESPANQSITVVSGASYAITLTGTVSITLSGATTGTVTAGTTSFTAGSTTLTCGSTSGVGRVHLRRTPSDSTYLKTAASSRFSLPYEWNKSGTLLGIRVEEARTNLIPTSAVSSYGLTNVTSSLVTDPAGDTKAVRITTTASAATNVVLSIAGAGNTNGLTYSIYAKQGSSATECNSFGLYNLTTTVTLIAGTINYGTGVWTTTSGSGTVTTSDVGNGWWKIAISKNSGISNGDNINVYAGYIGNVKAAGQYADFWNPQLEVGVFDSSPIETFGSTITRAADNISIATSNFKYGTSHSIFAEFYPFNVSAASRLIISIDDTTTVNSYWLQTTTSPGTRFQVTDGNVAQAQLDVLPGASTVNTVNKMAAALATNDFIQCSNGTLSSADSSGTIPTVTTVNFGNAVGVSQLFGYIRKFMYLPRRMTNTELQTLTV